jgi:hypothetical protein
MSAEIRKTFTSTEIKNSSGAFIESSIKGPTAISKNGRVIAVTVPLETFERLLEAEKKLATLTNPSHPTIKEYI